MKAELVIEKTVVTSAENFLVVEQRKDDDKRLNKRFTMEMSMHMAHMFHVATQQASLPAEQRIATPESIDIIKARRAVASAQSSSSSNQVGRQSITP